MNADFTGIPGQRAAGKACQSTFSDHPSRGNPICIRFQKRMPGLRAKMRDVDDRCRIVRGDLKFVARRQGLEPLAGLQNRQGAQQPGGIKNMSRHARQIIRMFHPVHRVVTRCPVTPRNAWHM